jgi:hypothetical protein
MFGSYARSARFLAVVFACAGASGCYSTRVPRNARLIWSGEVNQSGPHWKDIHPMASGQIYAVDHETGRVEGVETVWSGKPNFSFKLRPQRRYDLYFAQDNGPASRPS